MDRRFLAAYLPEIEEYLHYRSVDVSTIKELVKRWYPALNSGRPRKAGAHRALDDVIESIAEMKFYREHVFVPEVVVPILRDEGSRTSRDSGCLRRVRPNPVEGVCRVGTRCSSMSSSSDRSRESSFDALMP